MRARIGKGEQLRNGARKWCWEMSRTEGPLAGARVGAMCAVTLRCMGAWGQQAAPRLLDGACMRVAIATALTAAARAALHDPLGPPPSKAASTQLQLKLKVLCVPTSCTAVH